MLAKQQRILFITALAALGNFGLTSTASAQYGQYSGYSVQPVSYQQASYQPPVYRNNYYTPPPEILPFVPFDSAPIAGRNLFQSNQQTQQTRRVMNRSYQPQPRSYQPSPNRVGAANHLSAQRQQIIAAAKQQLGIKYRWGGNTPRQGFDCSGFTKYSLKSLGANIPRTAAQQSKASRTIKRSDLRPGDMIFFKTKGRRVNHVGIYLGNGKFIHAASGGGRVMTDDLRKNYWQKRLHKYGTFVG